MTPPLPVAALQPPVPGQFLGNRAFSFSVVPHANAVSASGQQIQLETVILMALGVNHLLFLYQFFKFFDRILLDLFGRLLCKYSFKVEGLLLPVLPCNLQFQDTPSVLLLLSQELYLQFHLHLCSFLCLLLQEMPQSKEISCSVGTINFSLQKNLKQPHLPKKYATKMEQSFFVYMLLFLYIYDKLFLNYSRIPQMLLQW